MRTILDRPSPQRRRTLSALAVAALTLFGLGVGLGVGGCSSATRAPASKDELLQRRAAADEQAVNLSRQFISRTIDRNKSEYDEFKAGKRPAPPIIDVLVISGGGDWGAFGAGFLKGWGQVPKGDPAARPDEFDIVTGVSTGALIAPFAFLGDEDSIEKIVHLYRNPKKDWVRRRGFLYFLPSQTSFAEVPGLERDLGQVMDTALIRRIAEAGDAGRVCAVNTSNVDDGAPRVFDLVAECRQAAANADRSGKEAKQRAKRVHDVLLASSGVPGAFPFRIIDNELYVDGCVTGNIIYGGRITDEDSVGARWQARFPDIPPPKTRYWVIFNNQTRPLPGVTAPNWPAVVSRSLEMGMRASTLTAIRHLYAMAEVSRLKHSGDVEVRLVSVPEGWSPPKPGVFVKETMNELADLGERMGADPTSWSTTPPP